MEDYKIPSVLFRGTATKELDLLLFKDGSLRPHYNKEFTLSPSYALSSAEKCSSWKWGEPSIIVLEQAEKFYPEKYGSDPLLYMINTYNNQITSKDSIRVIDKKNKYELMPYLTKELGLENNHVKGWIDKIFNIQTINRFDQRLINMFELDIKSPLDKYCLEIIKRHNCC